MTDPELQALEQQMAVAQTARGWVPHLGMVEVSAQVAADFFAARLERADRIETAARRLLDAHDTGMHRMPDHMAREQGRAALRAALEGP